MLPRIRLVTFDVLHTLITPKQPIHVQYAEVFRPYWGQLDPEVIKSSFKIGMLSSCFVLLQWWKLESMKH